MSVRARETDGDILVREALVAAFFVRRTYPDVAATFGDAFRLWSEVTPDDARRWAIIGPHGDHYRAFDPRLLERARSQFDPARARRHSLSAIKIGGPEEINPTHRFRMLGARELIDDETNLLEIRSPLLEDGELDVEQYVDLIGSIAARVPYDSGYASPALVYGVDSQVLRFAQAASSIALRHPGLDMPNNASSNTVLGTRLRGAFWITLVGPAPLQALGGAASLRQALPPEITMTPAGGGFMLRAGRRPTIGDRDRGDDLPLLRAMATVLEPACLFDDGFLDNLFISAEARARWERRLI